MVDYNYIKQTLFSKFSCHQLDCYENFDRYFYIDDQGYINGIAENAADFTIQAKTKLHQGLGLKFRNFRGSFYISNSGLSNLEGCPQIIQGNFYCSGNPLESLNGAPKIVTDRCTMINSNLKTSIGLPQQCQSYYISNNEIHSLEGILSDKKSLLIAAAKNKITTLQGCPATTEILDISENPIQTLKGISEQIMHLIISMPCPLLSLYDTQIKDFKTSDNTNFGLEFFPEMGEKYKADETLIRDTLQKYKNAPLPKMALLIALKRLGLGKYGKE
jgi:hypothetical protein